MRATESIICNKPGCSGSAPPMPARSSRSTPTPTPSDRRSQGKKRRASAHKGTIGTAAATSIMRPAARHGDTVSLRVPVPPAPVPACPQREVEQFRPRHERDRHTHGAEDSHAQHRAVARGIAAATAATPGPSANRKAGMRPFPGGNTTPVCPAGDRRCECRPVGRPCPPPASGRRRTVLPPSAVPRRTRNRNSLRYSPTPSAPCSRAL